MVYSATYRVLVADSQQIYARGLVAALLDEPDIVASVGPVEPSRLVAAAIDADADVVVLGIDADSSAALVACMRLSQGQPGIRVVVVSGAQNRPELADIVRAGATGMFTRTASIADAVATVRAALSGRSRLAPDVAARLMGELAAATRRADARAAPGGLTARELDVLRLVGDGLPNRDVAAKLHISENTVKNHMRSVHEKLGVRTRTEAVVTAVRTGLLGLR